MKINIDGRHIANECILSRANFLGTLLIVEGPSDSRLFKKFSDQSACKTIPAGGKRHAIDAIDILDKRGLSGALAIVDADYFHLDRVKLSSKNVLLTDEHDLELMLLLSNALDNVLDEHASPAKLPFRKRQWPHA